MYVDRRVYSTPELLKYRNIKDIPDVLRNKDFKIIKVPFVEDPRLLRRSKTPNFSSIHRSDSRLSLPSFHSNKHHRPHTVSFFPVQKLVPSENAWKPTEQTDTKKAIGILNKLSVTNFDKMIKNIECLDYNNIDIVAFLFKKASGEPQFMDLYIRFIKKMSKFNIDFEIMCRTAFDKNRDEIIKIRNDNQDDAELVTRKINKINSLIRFICKLYEEGYINEIEEFSEIVMTPKEDDIIMSCKFLDYLGPEHFENLVPFLQENKEHKTTKVKINIINTLEKYKID